MTKVDWDPRLGLVGLELGLFFRVFISDKFHKYFVDKWLQTFVFLEIGFVLHKRGG